MGKAEQNSQTNSNFSPEDILSEIVLPPPLAPQIDNFTCRNYKDCAGQSGELSCQRLRDQTNLTVREAFNDEICDNNLSDNCVNTLLSNSDNNLQDNRTYMLGNNFYDNRNNNSPIISDQNLSENKVDILADNSLHYFPVICAHNLSANSDNSLHYLPDNRTVPDHQKSISSEYFPQKFRTKCEAEHSDAEPPTQITLEEIDSSNGLCSDFSLYNSFSSEHNSNREYHWDFEQSSCKISKSEQYSNTDKQNYYTSEQNSYTSEQNSYTSEQNSYTSEQNFYTSEQNSCQLSNISSVLYRQQ